MFSEYNRKKLANIKCPKFATSIKQEIEEMQIAFLQPEEPKDPPKNFQQAPQIPPPNRSLSKGVGHMSTAS